MSFEGVNPDGSRRDRTDNLPRAVFWRTPAAKNAEQGPKSPEFFAHCLRTGQSQITLTDQVRMWPTPRSADGEKGIRTPAGAARERERRKNGLDLPSEAGGSLNPTWVEWLMGFPTGWTDLKPSETPLSPGKRIRYSRPSRKQ